MNPGHRCQLPIDRDGCRRQNRKLLPPIAKLNHDQAIYFFLNGYTSKIPGTEQNINEPEITFSACFGEAFLVHHPVKYGELFKNYIKKYICNIWLLNTGWIHGDYKNGYRIPIKYSRNIIDCIHNNTLNKVEYEEYPLFKFNIPKICDNIPSDKIFASISYSAQKFSHISCKCGGQIIRGRYSC